ncbi:YafY family transcriptional regulator [Treponema sp. OMZ 787]|uniref:helix-turn-helix transcriptional regulator n=1 Tax=Treponema sp. OMZ 787 TaxID=2563669 RepID=UPI0020A2627B|nr:YafY family protein [Treponema sp. OMZ 787]UTC61674.1 YafY family transcriptional regulator [Treponema sp. OMZ 787]
MKLERILEIIIYLLNHEKVSAKYLADYFNVSVRTIQRDMASIAEAGIPVYTLGGRYGGYAVLENYKIKNINIKNSEQQIIINALESLATSYTNDKLNSLIQKYNAIIEKEGGQKVFWDFSVTKENKKVQDSNMLLEEAINSKNYIVFDYRNSEGKSSHVCAEPLAIHYKWYAWYLFSYIKEKKEYRTFKVARMQNLVLSKERSFIKHGDIQQKMKEAELAYYKTCIDIEIAFDEKDASIIEEYFPDSVIEKISSQKYKTHIRVPARERLWKALLLSFGDKVKVISPKDYQEELIKTAKSFLSNYGKNLLGSI